MSDITQTDFEKALADFNKQHSNMAQYLTITKKELEMLQRNGSEVFLGQVVVRNESGTLKIYSEKEIFTQGRTSGLHEEFQRLQTDLHENRNKLPKPTHTSNYEQNRGLIETKKAAESPYSMLNALLFKAKLEATMAKESKSSSRMDRSAQILAEVRNILDSSIRIGEYLHRMDIKDPDYQRFARDFHSALQTISKIDLLGRGNEPTGQFKKLQDTLLKLEFDVKRHYENYNHGQYKEAYEKKHHDNALPHV